jgi:hypothetical protein
VRCGLDVGELSIFEDTKLEKLNHALLDSTNQMQKSAGLDTLLIDVRDQTLLPSIYARG